VICSSEKGQELVVLVARWKFGEKSLIKPVFLDEKEAFGTLLLPDIVGFLPTDRLAAYNEEKSSKM
jgi:hypothetical protein